MASKKEKTVFKKHKALDKVYHPDSGLVIKSATDKVVVGRISEDEFIPLDDECLELCEKYGFKYDETLVAEEDGAEEEAEQDAEETPEEVAEETPETVEPEKQPETKKKNSKAVEQNVEQEPEKQPVPQPEPKKKTKEEVKKAPEKPKGNDVMSELSSLVSSHSESLTSFVQVLLDRSTESQERCSKLEAEISTLKTQLEETKNKMKKLLSAMQNDL
jgi:outer membrane biosynthesis protein TonB